MIHIFIYLFACSLPIHSGTAHKSRCFAFVTTFSSLPKTGQTLGRSWINICSLKEQLIPLNKANIITANLGTRFPRDQYWVHPTTIRRNPTPTLCPKFFPNQRQWVGQWSGNDTIIYIIHGNFIFKGKHTNMEAGLVIAGFHFFLEWFSFQSWVKSLIQKSSESDPRLSRTIYFVYSLQPFSPTPNPHHTSISRCPKSPWTWSVISVSSLPAMLAATHVYAPASESMAWLMLNIPPGWLTCWTPSTSTALPPLNQVITGRGVPWALHGMSALWPTWTFRSLGPRCIFGGTGNNKWASIIQFFKIPFLFSLWVRAPYQEAGWQTEITLGCGPRPRPLTNSVL